MASQGDAAPAPPASHDPFSLTGDPLIEAVTAAVRVHMARYDGSHDFSHIRRVVGLARHLTHALARDQPDVSVDARVVTLAALLHDVGDRKYLNLVTEGAESADAVTALLQDTPYVHDAGARATAAVLHRCAAAGADPDLARRVVLVCQNVSWSHETRTAETAAAVEALAVAVPELAIVQDADRLDSLGAVGVARVFAYGSWQWSEQPEGRSLEESLEHFDEKLLKVVERMKTAEGRRLAVARTDRLRTFQTWFHEEASIAVDGETIRRLVE